MWYGVDPNTTFSYTAQGAQSAATALREAFPHCEVIISPVLLPNEFGHLDKAFIIYPFSLENDLPF
jgi:hypothetical protein